MKSTVPMMNGRNFLKICGFCPPANKSPRHSPMSMMQAIPFTQPDEKKSTMLFTDEAISDAASANVNEHITTAKKAIRNAFL